MPIGSFDYARSHFLVPRDSQVTDVFNFTSHQPYSFISTQMKYTLFGIIIFCAGFLTVGCLALIIVRYRKSVRRRKARIEEDPNKPSGSVNVDKLMDGLLPVSPHLSTTTAVTAATMNPGLSCSSVFSSGSGGACTPAETAELIRQWTGRQPPPLLSLQQYSSCNNSAGARSPQISCGTGDLRTSAMVDMQFQVIMACLLSSFVSTAVSFALDIHENLISRLAVQQ